MAAPTIVTPGHVVGNSGGAATSFVVTTPTHVAGDVIYIAICEDGVAALSLTDFTALYDDVDIAGTATFALFKKTAGASEPANYTVTSSLDERAAWMAWAVRGEDSVDAQATNATGTGTTATVNQIITTVADTLGIAIIAANGVATPVGDMTNLTQLDESSLTSGGTVSVHYQTIATATTAPSDSASLSQSQQWLGVRFAIAPVASAGDLSVNVSDSVAVAESVTTRVESYINKSESVGAAGSVNLALAHQVSVSDSIAVAESVSALLVSLISVSESVTAAESITVDIQTGLSVSESIAVAEAVTLAVVSFVDVADAVSVAEAVNIALAHQVNVSDAAAVAESVNVALAHQVAVAEAIAVTDTPTAYVTVEAIAGEAITVTEEITVVIPVAGTLTISVSESIVVTEVVTLAISTEIAVSEAITITEAAIVNIPLAISATEAIGVSEAVTVVMPDPLAINVSDGISVAELVTVVIVMAAQLSEVHFKGMYRGMFKHMR